MKDRKLIIGRVRYPGLLPDRILRMLSAADREALGKSGRTSEEILVSQQARNERELAMLVISYLALRGITAFRANPTAKSTIKVGFPDLWFSLHGQACAFEVKHGHRQLTPEQENVIARMREEGWYVEVVRSLADVVKMLQEWEQRIIKVTI